MFMGEYTHSLDVKNRVMFPTKFRDEIGDKEFVITRGLDHCLFLYPINEWEVMEEKAKNLSLNQKNDRAFVRFLFSGAVKDTFDAQGRIKIPDNLKDHAKLEKDVVITGALNRIEIWSKSVWDEYINSTGENFDEIAEKIIDL